MQKWTEDQLAEAIARPRGARIKSDSGTKLPESLPIDPPAAAVKSKSPQVIKAGKKPNKTEHRFFLEKLAPMKHSGEITHALFEGMRLKVGPACYLTPDYHCLNSAGRTVFFEIKGAKVWDDSIVKLKVAAGNFPFYQFFICQYKKGIWIIQEVTP